MLTGCGSNSGENSTNTSKHTCDWIDKNLIVKAVGGDDFSTHGSLASALDDSAQIADCSIVTDFGDKVVTIKYTGFTPGFKSASETKRAQEKARQKWEDGDESIPSDKKKLVPLNGYEMGTAYPTDHYIQAAAVTKNEFISVTIYNDAAHMTVSLADDIARSIKHNAELARTQNSD